MPPCSHPLWENARRTIKFPLTGDWHCRVRCRWFYSTFGFHQIFTALSEAVQPTSGSVGDRTQPSTNVTCHLECYNNGSCVPSKLPGPGLARCLCAVGWTGALCETSTTSAPVVNRTASCSPETCINGICASPNDDDSSPGVSTEMRCYCIPGQWNNSFRHRKRFVVTAWLLISSCEFSKFLSSLSATGRVTCANTEFWWDADN